MATQFETETHVVRVHQPQVDEWPKFDRIRFRSAITVAPKGQDDPTYGILVVGADTRCVGRRAAGGARRSSR